MFEPWPIVTNSGGVVDPHDLIGREREVDRLVRATRHGGAKLLGERRIGKTSILRAVETRLRDEGATVVRLSGEIDDPGQFEGDLITALRKPHRLQEALSRWGTELRVEVGPFGLTIASGSNGTAPPVDLFQLCADLTGSDGPTKLVFLFDEITTLARALERNAPGSAAAFFRSLRRPRQEIDRVSMILAGSIGLHHVLTDMSPVNDLDGVPIGPLPIDAATYLARCLLLGIRRSPDAHLARDIAEQAAGVPFYIHKIVQEITEGWQVEGPDDLAALVSQALRTNQWDTEHDLTRMAENFGASAELAMTVLDVLATESEPLEIADIDARLAVAAPTLRPSRTELIGVLDRLEDDHYLVRVGDASVFSHSLQRRVWRTVRRLG